MANATVVDSVEEKMAPSDSEKAGSTVDAGHITNTNNAVHSLTTRLDPAGNPLSPTPTSDTLDPLNWPLWRKYVCIAIACLSYFLMTYLTTAPIPSFFLLEAQFGATYSQTNWTFAISAFGLIFGPLLSGGLADIYGRRICMVVTTSVALLASGCTSLHGQSLGAYMFERFLQGLGAGSACNLGLSIINDVSFQHERGQRVGLWAIAANMGTFLGGVFGGFLVSVNQYWVAYQVTMAYAVLWLLTVFVLPETLYPRRQMLRIEFGAAGGVGGVDDGVSNSVEAPAPRTRKLPFFNVRRIAGLTYPALYSPWVVVVRLWAYPTIVLSILAYVYAQYWWIIALMTIEPLAYEDRSPQVQGLLFLGFVVGVLFAEAFCSGHASDRLVLFLVRKGPAGERTPEMRLWLGYPAAVLSALGCGLWGLSVDRGWHWMVGQVLFFLYAVGLQIGNTVLTTYMVDNYPTYANELSIFYSCIINLSAFLVPWFIYAWVEFSGYTWSFAIQGILCVLVIPAYAVLQKYGAQWRKPANFGVYSEDEYDPTISVAV
ncbi:MFS transporter [Sporothrix schenckii 1099-18]|uniref:MFS transporter n=1 Tax=Sporothrix schenckii 1099-18 TaxID=1397361 RepID=A0A0F2MM30_SPOSC|nr:MFS transporter [Sporothrix schenckii 1099-18]KJR89236.1 MFS transporter [Sporothrix schenckii 1099-18]